MTQNRVVSTTLQWQVDPSSVAAAQNANNQVAASFATVQDAVATLSADVLALNPDLSALATSTQSTSTATQQLADANQQLASSYTQVAQSGQSAQSVIRDIGLQSSRELPMPGAADFSRYGLDIGADETEGGGGFNPRMLTTVGRLVGGGAGRGISAVGRGAYLAESLGVDSTALIALGGAALVASPALIAAGLAVKGFTDEVAADQSKLDAAIKGTQTYAQAEGETSAQLAQNISSLTEKRAAEAQELATLQSAEQGAWNAAHLGIPILGDFAARLLDSADGTGKLRGEIEKLKPQVDGDTDSLGAMQRALASLQVTANDAAAAEQKRLEAEQQVAHQVSGLTTQQIQDKLSGAQQTLDIDQKIREQEGKALADVLTQQIDAAPGSAAAAKLQGQADALGKAIAGTDTAIATDQAAVAAWGQAILDHAGLAGDAAAADAALTQRELNSAHASADAEQMTAAQRQTATDALKAHITALAEYRDTLDQSDPAVAALNREIIGLNDQLREITTTTHSWADDLATIQSATDAITSSLDVLKQEGTIRDEISKTEAEIVQTKADATAKIGEIEVKASERDQEIVQNNADAVAKIEQTAASDHEADVGNRDALANYKDKQKAATALSDQQKNEDKQLKQVEQSEADQIAAVDQGETTKLNTLHQAQQQEEVDLTNVLASESALRQQAQSDTLQSTQAFYGAQGLVVYNSLQSMYQNTDFWMSAIANRFAQGIAALFGSASNGGIGAPLGASTPSTLNAAIDARVAQMVREASR